MSDPFPSRDQANVESSCPGTNLAKRLTGVMIPLSMLRKESHE
jgi:hypothetical protein